MNISFCSSVNHVLIVTVGVIPPSTDPSGGVLRDGEKKSRFFTSTNTVKDGRAALVMMPYMS